MKSMLVLLSLIPTLAFASAATHSSFHGDDWTGDYVSVNPACEGMQLPTNPPLSYGNLKVSFDGTNPQDETMSFTLSVSPSDKSYEQTQTYGKINGDSYISENSCFDDGLIVRSKVTADANEITEKDDTLVTGPFCSPTILVRKSSTHTIAQLEGEVLTYYGCVFKRAD